MDNLAINGNIITFNLSQTIGTIIIENGRTIEAFKIMRDLENGENITAIKKKYAAAIVRIIVA